MEQIEKRFSPLTFILPESLPDPELSIIECEEANLHNDDESYAFWKDIADESTSSGMTLRKKVQLIMMNRCLAKSTDLAESFTASLDSTDYLQVYVHCFELRDGESTLPVTYTPLTFDDMDITELTVYDSSGNGSILEVDTITPDYPGAMIDLFE